MKGSPVSYLNGNRKWRSEVLEWKHVVQWVLILIVCFWVLYYIHQIHTRDCGRDEVETQLRNKRIARLLGRKGGFIYDYEVKALNEEDLKGSQLRNKRIGKLLGRKGGLRYDSEVKALNEEDLNGADEEGVKHEAEDNEESDVQGQTEGINVAEEEKIQAEGEIVEKLLEIKENSSTEEDDDEKIGGINKTEEVPLKNIGPVILKKTERKLEASRLNADDGVSRHDSGPSRRNNMQINSSGNANILRFGNLSKEIDKCQKLCLKKLAQKKVSAKSEGKAVDMVMKDIADFESGHAGMRELLNIDD